MAHNEHILVGLDRCRRLSCARTGGLLDTACIEDDKKCQLPWTQNVRPEPARGGQFPLVTVRRQVPEDAGALTAIHADLEIQFAGQTAKYTQIPFQLVIQGDEAGYRELFQRRCPISRSIRRRS
jgi:hypothetical protein